MMTRQLIVNADDLGLSPGTNQGIFEAHQRGIVTSTTAMVNMPEAAAGIARLQAQAPEMGIGLHLVLTTGRPVLPPEQVPSLVQADGTFYYNGQQPLARAADYDPAEITAELRAQFDRFVTLAGRLPDHIDAHHHAAYHIPAAFSVLLELAEKHHLPIRRAATWLDHPDPEKAGPFDETLRALYAAGPQPRWPDYFETRFYDEQATLENLIALLAALPAGTTELMCHPGYYDGFPMYYAAQRDRELAVLTDPTIRAAVEAQGIRLITFAALAAG
jgi:predicted glycoside hydrolase/deacetylase ChbG (UPF0249 family)